MTWRDLWTGCLTLVLIAAVMALFIVLAEVRR